MHKTYRNATEIRNAVDNGVTVYADNDAYYVVKGKSEYLIKCSLNNYFIGLTWADGETLNGTHFFSK